jgi:hypothetical protein
MPHFVYKITFPETGEYYFGKHTTSKNGDDGYRGSGHLLEERKASGQQFIFEILSYHNSSKEAFEAEKAIIGDLWKTDDLCLNLVPGGKGGWEDRINWKGVPKSDEQRRKMSLSNSKPKSGAALAATIQNGKLGAEARRGQKDSEEVNRRRSESVSKATKGVPKKWLLQKYIIEGKEYVGMQSVTDAFGITRQTVFNRIKSEKWPDWNYANW